MSWLRVDDGFPSHEKVMALSEGPCRGDALALWLFCGCWSSHALRDGFVPTGVVRAFAFHPEAASELVRVGLWLTAKGGYHFHDWADYQPSAAQVEERRKAGAERKARSRAKLSAARAEPVVGVSRRDGGTVTRESLRDGGTVTGGVTGVPRAVSRTCLARASRDRDQETTTHTINPKIIDLSSSEADQRSVQQDPLSESASLRRPLGEPPPGLPPAEPPLPEVIVLEHAREYGVRRAGERPPEDRRAAVKLARWCEDNAALRATSPRELACLVLAGLFGSERAAQSRWQLSWAAKDPAEYLPPPAGSTPLPANSNGTWRRERPARGPIPVSSAEEIAADMADNYYPTEELDGYTRS